MLALDLLIPPLALYALSLGSGWLVSLLLAWCWPTLQLAAWVLSGACAMLLAAVALAWWRYGRHLLSASEMLTVPLYALWKLPVYLAYALRKRSGWVRTKRD